MIIVGVTSVVVVVHVYEEFICCCRYTVSYICCVVDPTLDLKAYKTLMARWLC